jgi:predicted nucleic acid-binding protein
MPVVSNTSPLMNLAIIGHLGLVRRQFGEIWIPPAVLKEFRLGEDLPGCRAVAESIETGWLVVKEVADDALVQVLQRDLDQGEAEAIALALQVKASWLLLDEREARRMAKLLKLKVTGLLGILLRAKYDGEFASLREVMERLQNQAGFHIAPKLFAEILQRVREI